MPRRGVSCTGPSRAGYPRVPSARGRPASSTSQPRARFPVPAALAANGQNPGAPWWQPPGFVQSEWRSPDVHPSIPTIGPSSRVTLTAIKCGYTISNPLLNVNPGCRQEGRSRPAGNRQRLQWLVGSPISIPSRFKFWSAEVPAQRQQQRCDLRRVHQASLVRRAGWSGAPFASRPETPSGLAHGCWIDVRRRDSAPPIPLFPGRRPPRPHRTARSGYRQQRPHPPGNGRPIRPRGQRGWAVGGLLANDAGYKKSRRYLAWSSRSCRPGLAKEGRWMEPSELTLSAFQRVISERFEEADRKRRDGPEHVALVLRGVRRAGPRLGPQRKSEPGGRVCRRAGVALHPGKYQRRRCDLAAAVAIKSISPTGRQLQPK